MKTLFSKKRKRTEEIRLDPRIKEKIFAIFQKRHHVENEFLLFEIDIDLTDEHVPYILAYLDSHPDINAIGFDSKLINDALSLLAQNNRLTRLTSLKPPGGSQELKINNQVIESLESNQFLTELNLTNFLLEPWQAESLLKKQNLIELRLGITRLNKELVTAALRNLTLTTLFLELNIKACFDEIFILTRHPTITELGLYDAGIDSKTAPCFLGNQVLKSLDLTFNYGIDNDAIALLLGHNNLTRLNLRQCEIDILPKTIAAVLNNLNLTTLVLGNNSVKDEGAAILSKHPNLTNLDLRSCDIGNRGAFYLANNSRLISLDLLDNSEIGFLGAIALALNQSLSYLDLEGCEIGNLGALFLLGNQTLRYLDVRDNDYVKDSSEEYYPISDERQNELDDLPTRNTALQSQYHEAVEQNLRKHLPTDLVKIVRDYTKGEYPYQCQLFNNRLNSQDRHQLKKNLPRINQFLRGN
jgi:hypothetical protein